MAELIEQEWRKFREACFPKTLGAGQETAMRTAFFAGAFVTLGQVATVSDRQPEAEAIKTIAGIKDELNEAMKEIMLINKQRN